VNVIRNSADHGDVAVLIPAAGSGSRLGGRRKQFRELGGRPVLVQTLLVFERHPLVDHVIVATPKDAVRPLRQELRRVGITKLHGVVPGGETRQESVRAALESVPDEVDVVLVHDAVRPFVRMGLVDGVIAAARSGGAAAPAIPVTDTLRRATDGRFGDTVDRRDLMRMQTPQGFRRDWLLEAHEAAAREGVEATDDVELVRHVGHAVQVVQGSEDNVKITTPDDWERATAFWTVWEAILRLEGPLRDTVTGHLHP